MALLNKNASVSEVQRGCVFSENFKSNADIILNQGAITGTLTIPNPNQALFSGTQKIVYPTINNIKTISFWITLTSTTESIIKLTSSHSISVSAGTLAATGFSSPTIRVNGVATTAITTSRSFVEIDTSTAINCNDIQVGYIAAFGNFKMEALKFWTAQLTLQESLDYYNNASFNYSNKFTVDLPMDMNSYDLTNKLILDRSRNGNNFTLGDGSTASTFPTKLTTKGFSFDGGDYLKRTQTLASGSFTVFFLIQKSSSATGYLLDCTKSAGTGSIYFDASNVLTISSGTIYIDGLSQASYTGDNINRVIAIQGITLASTEIQIGSNNIYGVNFNGNILDFKLFSGSLTPLQILDESLKLKKEINRI